MIKMTDTQLTKAETEQLKKQLRPGSIIIVKLSALHGARQSRSKKAAATCVVTRNVWYHAGVRRYFIRVCAPMNPNTVLAHHEYSIGPGDVIEVTGRHIND